MQKKPIFKKITVLHGLSRLIFPTPKRSVNVGSKKHKKEYLTIYAGYDCETTNCRTPDGWRATIYIHQMAIANNSECVVYLLRTWEEILNLFETIRDHYNLSDERRIIIWDANLSFEFSFLCRRMSWSEVFAKEVREPLMAHSSGLDFRDCLTISGGGLANLAKTYTHTQKLVGDLDYAKPRNPQTALTPQEEAYCINDVVILAEFSYIMFRDHIIPSNKIPMTKTGLLLEQAKKEFNLLSRKAGFASERKKLYQEFIGKAYPDEDTYNIWFAYLFRGGYVHANALFVGVDINPFKSDRGVDMVDITSSYPAYMMLGYVPITPFKKVNFNSDYLNKKACILFATFKKIRITTPHSIESKNKIIDAVNPRYDNGRLVSADLLRVALTEFDFKIYDSFYKWTEMQVESFYIAERGKLPRFLLNCLKRSYIDKNRLKKSGLQHTSEYAIKKSEVNSWYGACVKRIRLDSITYTDADGWCKKINDKVFDREASKSLLLPQWGIWITAGARYNLLSVVKKMTDAGVNVVYGDTDSIKYIANSKAKKIIKNYNARIARRLKNRGLRSEFLQGLGAYERENVSPVRFKTLGAKRYIYTEDNLDVNATIAGLPKKAFSLSSKSCEEIFNDFSECGIFFPPSESLKKTTAYTDEPYSLYIDGVWCDEESGVALYDIPFSMKLTDEYKDYIRTMKELSRVGFRA